VFKKAKSPAPCVVRGFFLAYFFTTVVILKSLPFICHSGLDKACPVLDAGKSSVSGLDSCWSLSRWKSGQESQESLGCHLDILQKIGNITTIPFPLLLQEEEG